MLLDVGTPRSSYRAPGFYTPIFPNTASLPPQALPLKNSDAYALLRYAEDPTRAYRRSNLVPDHAWYKTVEYSSKPGAPALTASSKAPAPSPAPGKGGKGGGSAGATSSMFKFCQTHLFNPKFGPAPLRPSDDSFTDEPEPPRYTFG